MKEINKLLCHSINYTESLYKIIVKTELKIFVILKLNMLMKFKFILFYKYERKKKIKLFQSHLS